MFTNTIISNKLLAIARERGLLKSVCPSEIARMLFQNDWRSHMEQIRKVAIALEKLGKVIITQNDIPVSTDFIEGPIRIKISKL